MLHNTHFRAVTIQALRSTDGDECDGLRGADSLREYLLGSKPIGRWQVVQISAPSARGNRFYLVSGSAAVLVAVANGHSLLLESVHGFKLQFYVSLHLEGAPVAKYLYVYRMVELMLEHACSPHDFCVFLNFPSKDPPRANKKIPYANNPLRVQLFFFLCDELTHIIYIYSYMYEHISF